MPPARIIQGNALALPLADESVDLICTSPPYFGLRSYQDGGEHYEGQIGSEATPTEFLDALIAATAEMVRVLKPSGSIFVNLGDKYSSGGRVAYAPDTSARRRVTPMRGQDAAQPKSLLLIPERYRIRCVDELGLIARAVIVWSKPNGLPESVTDRVRRSHEDWVHLTKLPRYYSAVDEIREAYDAPFQPNRTKGKAMNGGLSSGARGDNTADALNPLGKLPGSVWTIPTEPLAVPEHLGVDHFAAYPTEWPRRIIAGWSPREVCTACGEGRRPVSDKVRTFDGEPVGPGDGSVWGAEGRIVTRNKGVGNWRFGAETSITGYACACPDTTAPATPGVCLDPFGGTGTTALVATALGRHGISVDMSADYCRLATWRTTDPKQLAKAAHRPYEPPRKQVAGQSAFEFGEVS